MRTVIERLGHSIDHQGIIHYDDRPSTYEKAESVIGKRLDRRRNYAILHGDGRKVCELVTWSAQCSGCDGGGCKECGYHGIIRRAMWLPVELADAGRDAL
ncbi:hypothetical protein [Azospirillum canadense]|uniref:hypothetical protein n=1 Tax=Azospirillum canadense TaxID=403962 RepID=UPI0022280133|nr:hypothetical protein [Azospirillum canadense]MCW2242303.1 hypothetical protein [Azospirillum canadense]